VTLMRDRPLASAIDCALTRLADLADRYGDGLTVHEVGSVRSVGHGTAVVSGLPGVRSEELVEFPDGSLGMAFNLDEHEIGVILLGHSRTLRAGDEVRRTHRVTDVPVGHGLLGRVIDPTGRALDSTAPLRAPVRWPIERPARAILDRAPVSVPLHTGLKVVDALVPIGRGQRELILGDRQTGKSTVAIDTILHQHDQDVICVYCAIGQRSAAVAHVLSTLRRHGALAYSVVVVASGEQAPGLQFIAPYAATSIAEFFMEEGRDVLIVYDDLTKHARAYRELSLLLRRPPGREAYPGDIFYVHSRLLERATHLRPDLGGGSLTALPIVETEAQNLAAYIPTNLISITDGQIYLSPDLFQKAVLPPVHVGLSVSRVGGKTQLPAYRAVAADVRLAYAQFEELEAFARFGTRLDDDTRHILARGQRIREVLKQPQHATLPAAAQIVTLLAVTAGLFDAVELDHVADAEEAVCEAVRVSLPDIWVAIERGDRLADDARDSVLSVMRTRLQGMSGGRSDGHH
jgi:F-type H+-transporting ATPase subunit alpha